MYVLDRIRTWLAMRNLRTPRKRESALDTLVRIGEPATGPLLDAAEKSDSPYVRQAAARALRQIAGDSIVRSRLHLVYPIYLDTPMMTGLLASLEGGLVREADLERKTGDTRETAADATLRAGASGLLSGLLEAGASANLASTVSESLESHYKSTVRFPNATLFITLRNLLLQQGYIKVLDSAEDFADVAVGEIVEFEGHAVPGPAYQIRRAFSQMLPLLKSSFAMRESQIDQLIAQLEATRPNEVIEFGEEQIEVQGKKHATQLQSAFEARKGVEQAQSGTFQQIGQVLNDLFPEGHMSTILFKRPEFKAVSRVYPAFTRNERVDEIYDAHWNCLGKVIGVVSASDEYELLKDSPISYFARDQYAEIVQTFETDELSISTTESVVTGPAVIVATLAIFI